MVFVVIPNDVTVITWVSIIKKIKNKLKEDFRNITKVKYYRMSIAENVEEETFKVYTNLLLLEDDKILRIKPMKNKAYEAIDNKNLNILLEQLLENMDSSDSVCVIDNSLYKRINKFLEDRLEIIEYKIEGVPILYIESNIGTEKEDDHAIHSLRPFRR